MQQPHIGEFWLLEGVTNETQPRTLVLAVGFDRDSMITLCASLGEKYPEAFFAYRLTLQGGFLEDLESLNRKPTNSASTMRS